MFSDWSVTCSCKYFTAEYTGDIILKLCQSLHLTQLSQKPSGILFIGLCTKLPCAISVKRLAPSPRLSYQSLAEPKGNQFGHWLSLCLKNQPSYSLFPRNATFGRWINPGYSHVRLNAPQYLSNDVRWDSYNSAIEYTLYSSHLSNLSHSTYL